MVYKFLIRGLVLSILFAATGCRLAQPSVTAHFSRVAGSVSPGDLRGPFTGRVVDAGTKRAIAGATVVGVWIFRQGPRGSGPSSYRRVVVRTNLSGRYVIPRISRLRRVGWKVLRRDGVLVPIPAKQGPSDRGELAEFVLLVYKRGYVAYRSDRLFGNGERRRDFVQYDNRVRLVRWSSNYKHADHVRFIGMLQLLGRDGAWELQLARQEEQGATTLVQQAAGRKQGGLAPSSIPDLRSLVTRDDLAILFGVRGVYELGRLPTMPRTWNADSLYLRAVGRSERYDFAVRVWRYPASRLQLEYRRMLQTYPHVRKVDKVGDASFESENANVLGHVFVMKEADLVVSVTCGRDLCKNHDGLLRACRLVEYRLDKLIHKGSEGPNPDKYRREPVAPRLEK